MRKSPFWSIIGQYLCLALLTLSAEAATSFYSTVTNYLGESDGTTTNIPVTITPRQRMYLSYSGLMVLPDKIVKWSTNGAWYATLLGGLYDFDFGFNRGVLRGLVPTNSGVVHIAAIATNLSTYTPPSLGTFSGNFYGGNVSGTFYGDGTGITNVAGTGGNITNYQPVLVVTNYGALPSDDGADDVGTQAALDLCTNNGGGRAGPTENAGQLQTVEFRVSVVTLVNLDRDRRLAVAMGRQGIELTGKAVGAVAVRIHAPLDGPIDHGVRSASVTED